MSQEWQTRFFLSRELGRRPAPCATRQASALQLAGGAGPRTIRVVSTFLPLLTWLGGCSTRGTLCEPPPPKGKVLDATELASKVLGCPASLEERGDRQSMPGWPAWKRSSGCRASPAPGTLGTSHGPGGTKCALLRPGDSGWSWQQRQAQPRFPSAPGEASNKSCLSHFITLLARADSGRSQPGPDLASPLSSHCTSRSHQEFVRPGVSSGRWLGAQGTRRAASLHPVLPQQLWAAGRTRLPAFCRDRRPFCCEPLSWGPSGGFVESVPRAGSKVANTKARVTNWPSRSAHMVLGYHPAAWRPGFFVRPSSSSSSSAAFPLLPLFLLAGPFPPPRRGSDRGYPAPSRSSPESM